MLGATFWCAACCAFPVGAVWGEAVWLGWCWVVMVGCMGFQESGVLAIMIHVCCVQFVWY